MTDNDGSWWESNKEEQDSQTSIDKPKNVFSGDVSSFSTPQSANMPQITDPNKFLVSQFLVGLILVPIIASFLMSFIILSSERANEDDWYYDSINEPNFEGIVTINNEDLNTAELYFDIPSFSLEEINDDDLYFQTSADFYDQENWDDYGGCWWDSDDGFYSYVQSDDGDFWYPMNCWGSLENYDFYFQKDGQIMTYATNFDSQISYISVDGDKDISVSSFLLFFLPFIIPVAYIAMIIWSFVNKKKSLGLGLLGGIIIAPFSFCFSMIFLSFLFWDV
jgi:hypothetical protein